MLVQEKPCCMKYWWPEGGQGGVKTRGKIWEPGEGRKPAGRVGRVMRRGWGEEELGGPHPAVESSSAPAGGGRRRDGPLLGASSRHPLSVYLSRTSPVKHRAGPRLCFRPPRRPGPRVRIRTRITIRTRIARSRQRRPLPVLFRFRSGLHDCETAVDETTPPCQAKAQRALDAHRSADLRAHRCL